MSPLQNEEKFSFRILSDNGIFNSSINSSKNSNWKQFNESRGDEFRRENSKDVFFSSEPILETESVIYDITKVLQNNNQSSIIIIFDGKFTPRKVSEFTLDFSNFDNKTVGDLIINSKENRLTIDEDKEKGRDKKSIVDIIMNYNFNH